MKHIYTYFITIEDSPWTHQTFQTEKELTEFELFEKLEEYNFEQENLTAEFVKISDDKYEYMEKSTNTQYITKNLRFRNNAIYKRLKESMPFPKNKLSCDTYCLKFHYLERDVDAEIKSGKPSYFGYPSKLAEQVIPFKIINVTSKYINIMTFKTYTLSWGYGPSIPQRFFQLRIEKNTFGIFYENGIEHNDLYKQYKFTSKEQFISQNVRDFCYTSDSNVQWELNTMCPTCKSDQNLLITVLPKYEIYCTDCIDKYGPDGGQIIISPLSGIIETNKNNGDIVETNEDNCDIVVNEINDVDDVKIVIS